MHQHTKENVLIIAAVALIVGIGLLGVAQETIPPAAALNVESHAMKTEEVNYSFDIEYPSFSGISDKKTQDDLNARVEGYVKSAMDSFKLDTAQALPSPTDGKNSFFMRYEIELLRPDFVSIRFEPSTYAAGAAHPYSFSYAMNYNLRTDNEVTTPEGFFIQGTDYLATLSSYAEKALLDQFGKDASAMESMVRSGAAPKAENYRNLFLTEKGLLVVFDPYQVAPYAAGSPKITIPYDELAGVMRENLLTIVLPATSSH